MRQTRRERWDQFSALLDRSRRWGIRSLTVDQVKQLCRLYRHVTIDLSQARAAGEDQAVVQYLNSLAARGHGQVYITRGLSLRAALQFIAFGFAIAIRRNWRVVAISAGVFLLTTLASALAVVRSPELAYSLFDPDTVESENIRLEKQQGEYRGNFTFPPKVSPLVAAVIILNNVKVAVLGFALGAMGCVLGLFLLVYQGRMLGTLSGLVFNGGYLIGFYSLIMTHGVLELSAICIATAGGLRLGWAAIAPGQLTRADAFRLAAGDAFALLAGSIVMLMIAGMIEAYVSPHFGAEVRWSVAAGTGTLFALYVALAGRRGHNNPRSITSK
jgi:uncharacterized membrane protein SpoIIM required for sporulation